MPAMTIFNRKIDLLSLTAVGVFALWFLAPILA